MFTYLNKIYLNKKITFKKAKVFSIIIVLILFIFLNFNSTFKYIYNDKHSKKALKWKDNEISIVLNINNLTKKKHILYNNIMKKFNSTRSFYFIKTKKYLNKNLNKFVENSLVKIVQSNFPDSIFLPLVVSLYGNTIPELVLFIEGDELLDNSENNLIKWTVNAYEKIMTNKYDYIFGNSIFIEGKKIGCSLLLSKASIIEHLLYYTDSDTSHAHPFIQLSLATQTKYAFFPFNYIKSSNFEMINGRISLNMDCPSIDDKENQSFCIMIPAFKRNYFPFSFPAFSNQTYRPKYYIIIQNENKMHYNLSLIQKMVSEPVYHIWMQNWNSFFYLNLRLSSVFPCDFILKYDDDQWPIESTIQQKLINIARGKNIIIGRSGYLIRKSYCGYSPKKYKKIDNKVVDHSAVPILMRPGYIKLDARNNIYRLYGGEDIALSLNSWKLCNVTSKKMKMKLIEKQKDGKNQRADKQIISAYKNDKETNFHLFEKTYCYYIRSGYKPKTWDGFQIPKKDYIDISIKHKRLN